ncbi:ankyrin-3-like isoform X2 [Mya arenaria]|nr:ankyrin-3-like isoform X2 [Mya arenaria]
MKSDSGDEQEVGPPLTEETRRIQAQLHTRLMSKNLNVETLEKYKDYLDLPIAVDSCTTHLGKLLMVQDELEDNKQAIEDAASYIIQSNCGCDHAQARHEMTLVHLSCLNEALLPVLKYLQKAGCDLEARHCKNTPATPLTIAVKNWNTEAVKFLLSHNVSTGGLIGAEEGNPPLYYALRSNLPEIANLLIAHPGINLDAKSSRGSPILHAAVRMPDFPFLETLLKAGANPNIMDNDNRYTALLICVTYRLTDAIRILLRYRADVNQRNYRGDSALTVAVYGSNKHIIQMLLDAGADPNTHSNTESPLFIACYEDDIDIVRLLIKHKANINVSNEQKYTPLHVAAWNGHLETVRELLKFGAPHDIKTNDGNTPLGLAAHGCHLSVMKELLQLGCNVNNKDKDEDDPILYASYNGMTRGVELLLEHGANANSANRVNATPLWNAVYEGHKETVKLLLKTNVYMEKRSVGINQHHQSDDVLIIYDTERSSLWVAVCRGYTDIALLLLTAGYDVTKEEWIYSRNFPNELDEDDNREARQALQNMLVHASQTPSRLITLCRNRLRKILGVNIASSVQKLDIPLFLQSYLCMADLKYSIEEKKEDSKADMEDLDFDFEDI